MGSEKKIVPRVTYPASAPKRVVKFQTFPGFEIDKSVFTAVKMDLSPNPRKVWNFTTRFGADAGR